MINSERDPAKSATTILVVEDDVLVRLVVCDALRDAGLQVVEVESADEALLYLKTDSSVELVFSDVRLPGSLDGIELAKRLKLDFPHLKVVLTSGHLLPSEVGMDLVLLRKPYPLAQLAARIVEILEDGNSIG